MIKCEVIKEFTLESFDKLVNLKRANINKKNKGYLYVEDTFECTKEMAEYLTGNNPVNETVVRVIEVIPEKEKNKPIENKIDLSKEKNKSKVTNKKNTTKKQKNKSKN